MVSRDSSVGAAPHRRQLRSVAVSAITLLTVAGLSVIGAGRSAAATAPTFVQQASAHAHDVTKLAVTPPSPLASGDRLVVEVGVWSSANATTSSVTDSVGDSFVELTHFTASDHTELSVWSAPVTAGGGTTPTVTANPTGTADVGLAVLEYSGLSTVSDASIVDQMSTASGTTGAATTVSSGATAATSTSGELAVGFYADSGFGDSLTAGGGFTARTNVSNTGDMEMLVEDETVAAGATPAAAVGTGGGTVWLMATVVLRGSTPVQATTPSAPTSVVATAGDSSAAVTWVAPSDGNSVITSYTVTPYVGSAAQPSVTVSGSPPSTSANFANLTNGTTYTFTVYATNAVGNGPTSSASNPVTPGTPSTEGQFSSLMSWPIVAVHSILMANGKSLLFDGWQQPQPTYVWNPASQAFEATVDAPDSIFCSGTAEMPDGKVLVIGGYGGLTTGQSGIVDTNIFDPGTETWTRVANMHSPRWYPDLTELSDGRYVAISGSSTTSTTYANTPEVYDPVTNTWTQLSPISTSQVQEPEYPFSYLVPNGNVFVLAPSVDKSFELNVNSPSWTQVGGASGVNNGSSVMYLPGHILYTGGAPSAEVNTSATATAATIDLTSTNPAWQPVTPMNYARIYHTLTMLANGEVLAVGGEAESNNPNLTADVTQGVLPAEIWNPNTDTWTTVSSLATARNYHSTAVLQPDGTVLVAGGGHEDNNTGPGQYSAQIYSPPYLFAGSRPTISSMPSTTGYGKTITVGTPDAGSIAAVNLVSLGADTHQIDMDQHFVPLSFTSGSGSLAVQMPSSASVAPPGNYMLFILNSAGVPSVASIINVGPAADSTVPASPTNVVATAGDGSASVAWTAPADNNSAITSYTVTPYIGGVAGPSVMVPGGQTTANVDGLTNGTAYTFTVAATNGDGLGARSAASSQVVPTSAPLPAFVQQASAHGASVARLSVVPPSPLGANDRLVVEAGIWNSSSATAASVTDSAGDVFTELIHFKASDGTEMSIWSAPVTAGAGIRPTITVTPTSPADTGLAVSEYSGLSTVSDASVLDRQSTAAGTTGGSAATVTSGPTAATNGANELAVGFYADSGFGNTLSPGSGYSVRSNVSPTGDMEVLTEDQVVPSGATPSASARTGQNTVWLMATAVLKSGAPVVPTVPGAPSNVVATAGNGSATVTWAVPSDGNSPITYYTVTPYLSGAAQTPVSVSGSPPPTTVTMGSLTDGDTYTFTVSATNSVGTGQASTSSNPVTPTLATIPQFVQQVSGHASSVTGLSLTPAHALGSSNRLVVEASTWSASSATIKSVTDSAGDTFVQLLHFTAPDGTEMSVWSAPVNAGAGTAPSITVTPTGKADVGAVALEYSGLSALSDTSVLDSSATAAGTTGAAAAAVSSGPTGPASAGNELAIGFYADSGFGDNLSGTTGWTTRSNVSPTGNVEMLAQDQLVTTDGTATASVATGANTVWLMATVLLKTS